MSGFSTARQKMVDGQVRPSDVTDTRILDAMLALPREALRPRKQAGAGLSGPRSRCQRGGRGSAVPDQAGGAGEDAAGGRDQGDRPCSGRGLCRRIRGGTDFAFCRAGGCDRERAGTGREGHGDARAARLWKCSGSDRRGSGRRPGDAPFDVIVLNGATEIVPERLYAQLRDGGRLVGVFATSTPPRATIVMRSHGDFGHRALFDAAAPVLPGLERVPAFVF